MAATIALCGCTTVPPFGRRRVTHNPKLFTPMQWPGELYSLGQSSRLVRNFASDKCVEIFLLKLFLERGLSEGRTVITSSHPMDTTIPLGGIWKSRWGGHIADWWPLWALGGQGPEMLYTLPFGGLAQSKELSFPHANNTPDWESFGFDAPLVPNADVQYFAIESFFCPIHWIDIYISVVLKSMYIKCSAQCMPYFR